SEALQVSLAIAGTFNLNWVDRALVLASRSACTIGVQSHSHCQTLDEDLLNLLRSRGANLEFSQTLIHDPNRHELDSLAGLFCLATGQVRQLDIALNLKEGLRRKSPLNKALTILIAPGAGDSEKVFPLEKMKRVAEALSHKLSDRP